MTARRCGTCGLQPRHNRLPRMRLPRHRWPCGNPPSRSTCEQGTGQQMAKSMLLLILAFPAGWAPCRMSNVPAQQSRRLRRSGSIPHQPSSMSTANDPRNNQSSSRSVNRQSAGRRLHPLREEWGTSVAAGLPIMTSNGSTTSQVQHDHRRRRSSIDLVQIRSSVPSRSARKLDQWILPIS